MITDRIIELCKQRDREGQAALYYILAPKLLAVAYRYMQQREEAEDVMQDAFVKVFTKIGTYRNEGSFEGWAKRITVHIALNALKKKNRISFENTLIKLENVEFVEEEADYISQEDILSCMRELPDGYRTILNLYLIEEFSHKEIAEHLKIEESTSRSQFTRARQALMKLIKTRTAALNTQKA